MVSVFLPVNCLFSKTERSRASLTNFLVFFSSQLVNDQILLWTPQSLCLYYKSQHWAIKIYFFASTPPSGFLHKLWIEANERQYHELSEQAIKSLTFAMMFIRDGDRAAIAQWSCGSTLLFFCFFLICWTDLFLERLCILKAKYFTWLG